MNALRQIATTRPKPVIWRDKHAYFLGEDIKFEPSSENDLTTGTVQISGFVRGVNLNVDRLVHLPNYGDFQIQKVKRNKKKKTLLFSR